MRRAGIRSAVATTVEITVDTSNAADPAPEYASAVDLWTDPGLTSDDEECSVDPQLAATLGIVLADCGAVQLRITRSTGESAIFTVAALVTLDLRQRDLYR